MQLAKIKEKEANIRNNVQTTKMLVLIVYNTNMSKTRTQSSISLSPYVTEGVPKIFVQDQKTHDHQRAKG